MIGKTILRYKILEMLGEGGMGVVYKAEDTRLKRLVALKFLPPDLTRDKEANERFICEAQAASALDHQNLCTIHEIDESDDGRMFIAMAYYEGETLKERVAKCEGRRVKGEGREAMGGLSINDVIDIAMQIALGLVKAHEKGIIHRDIKPANVIVQRDGTVKIIDFGLSKLAGVQNITQSGSTMGTIAYMSEEQALGKEVDHRSDIWSLGVVLYEMLTGQQPFKAKYDETVLYLIMNEKPKPVTTLRSEVPVELERIIEKALQKDPGNRYKNVAEMLDELKTLRNEMDSGATQVRKGILVTPRGRRFVLRSAIVSIIITLAASSYLYLGSNKSPTPISIAVVGFENMTGDSTYNNLRKALPNLLITSLEQSPHLQVATWERLNDLLKQTGTGDADFIDKETGFELCRRTGINIIVTGSFTMAGGLFVTDAKVLDVKTKELIKSARSKGRGVASILDMQIDEISDEIAKGIGSYTRMAATIPTRIVEFTTPSLEAYNYFTRGREEFNRVNPGSAVKFLKKAIELDSTFSSAYLYLGLSEIFIGNMKARNIAYDKAKQYRTHASTKERLYIDMSYAWAIEHDFDKVLRILNQMSARYPNEKTVFHDLGSYYSYITKNYEKAIPAYKKALALDPYYQSALNRLAYAYVRLGKYEKALKHFQRLAAVSPGDANPFDSMADCYFSIGKIEEAYSKYKEATDVDTDFIWSYIKRAYIHALNEDYSKTLEICDQAILSVSTAGFEALGHYWKGFFLFWLGQMDQALEELKDAEEFWGNVDNTYGIAHVEWLKAWISYERGKYDLAKKQIKNWFTGMSGSNPQRIQRYKIFYSFNIGFFELQQGRFDSAAFRLQQIKILLPEIKENLRSTKILRQKILESEILLKNGQTAQALELYKSIKPIDMDYAKHWNWMPYNVPFYHDLQARTYVQNGEIKQAIAEYNRLITFNPEKKERYLIQPRYHYRLARLYEKSGETRNAIRQYQKFMKIWENADPELPELIDARERLAKLRGEERRVKGEG